MKAYGSPSQGPAAPDAADGGGPARSTLASDPSLPAESVTTPNTFSEIVAAVRGLEPALAARREEADALCQLPADVVQSLRAAGCFRLAMPAEWGGPDLTPIEQVMVIEELSRIDAAFGWCVMIGMDSGLYSRYLQPATARELFPHLDMIVAGQVAPLGTAHETNGGFTVEGHWRFGSGCTHADLIVGGCTIRRDGQPVLGPEGRPLTRIVVMPPSQVNVLDTTWRTTGLAATGSHDYAVGNLFVPTEHTLSLDEPVHGGPLTRRSDALVRKMPGVGLGAGRAALDFVQRIAVDRLEGGSATAWANTPRVQSAVGYCEVRLATARSLVFSSLEVQWEHLLEGRAMDTKVRADAALSRYESFRAAQDVAQTLYDLVGGESIYTERTPLDRSLRDMTTACQHVVAQRRMLEWCGQLLLGGQPNTPFI